MLALGKRRIIQAFAHHVFDLRLSCPMLMALLATSLAICVRRCSTTSTARSVSVARMCLSRTRNQDSTTSECMDSRTATTVLLHSNMTVSEFLACSITAVRLFILLCGGVLAEGKYMEIFEGRATAGELVVGQTQDYCVFMHTRRSFVIAVTPFAGATRMCVPSCPPPFEGHGANPRQRFFFAGARGPPRCRHSSCRATQSILATCWSFVVIVGCSRCVCCFDDQGGLWRLMTGDVDVQPINSARDCGISMWRVPRMQSTT